MKKPIEQEIHRLLQKMKDAVSANELRELSLTIESLVMSFIRLGDK